MTNMITKKQSTLFSNRYALKVRRSPLAYKNDKQIFDCAETLAEPLQRFADVLEKELKVGE